MKKNIFTLLILLLVGCQKSWTNYSCQNISENEQKKSFSTDGKSGVMGDYQYFKCEKKGNITTFVGKGEDCQKPVITINFDDVSESLSYYFSSSSGILVKQYQCEKVR